MALVSAFALLFASGAWFGAMGYVVFFLVAAISFYRSVGMQRPDRRGR